MLVAGVQSIFALTTQEIVALAKPTVVYIKAWNSYNPNYVSTGTGFFVAKNMIITDCHVLSGDGKFQPDSIVVLDLLGNQINVNPDPLYSNSAKGVDLSILSVTDSVEHSYLRLSSTEPSEGQNVTVVGNPKGYTGTVTTGIVSAIREDGLVQFSAPVSPGSSGSPVLNDNGEVIGIVDWIVGSELAQNLNFATSFKLLNMAITHIGEKNTTIAMQQLQPPPQPAIIQEEDKVALLIYHYLTATQYGKPVSLAPYVTNILYSWYGDKDVPRERAEKENVDYYRHWPNQAIQFDADKIWVKRMEREGAAIYHVQVPFSYFISNGKETKKGEKVFDAFVILTTNGVGYRIVAAQNL
jgi:V8-like Glu-specific endopeptidase